MLKNCSRKTKILKVSFSCLILIFANQLFAKDIILGGKEGWPVFQKSENLTTGKGRFGYECIELATNSFETDFDTDLLINFENSENPIASGDYRILTNNLKPSTNTKNDKFAGLSRNIGGLSIAGNPGTFFGSEGLNGSFSIEFWIYPSVVENGEILLSWESSRLEDGRLIHQLLNAIFNKGHIEWSLSNFFDSDFISPDCKEITLKGTSNIIPNSWSYHALSFDAETGILEYVVNGITESLIYVTSTKDESGEVALVNLGTPAEIELCKEYTGLIDDIRIVRRPYSSPDFQSAENAGKIGHTQYAPQGGIFITKPIMVSTGSRLNMLKAEMNVPAQTEICYYVRSGNNFYDWTKNPPEWIPVVSGETVSNITGLYFQVMAEFLPDGDGSVTPTLTQLTLSFDEIPSPLPPFIVKAEAGNGSVTVSWNYSVDDTAGGYYLYYGNRPGEYLGRIAIEGFSPINVGNKSSFTVTGLENGKIYYFAIAAYSALDESVIGEKSKEVFARPLARLK